MNTVSLETAVFGLYAVAALAFCLGFVVAGAIGNLTIRRIVRAAQAAPPTDVRITATGRRERRPTGNSPHEIDRQMRAELEATPPYAPRRRGPRDWPTE